MREKTFGRARKWLNPRDHRDSGMLCWEVSADAYAVDASFSVWDCSRKITLDFNIYDHKDAKIRAEKLDILITELTKMREAMADAYVHYDTQDREDSISIGGVEIG